MNSVLLPWVIFSCAYFHKLGLVTLCHSRQEMEGIIGRFSLLFSGIEEGVN